MTPRILIAGVGNIFLGDDAFGSEVARQLLRRPWPANVRVEDFGIRSFDLAFALHDNYDAAILIDATPRGGAPGTIYTIEPDLSELDRLAPEAAAVDTHGMNPMRVLAMAKSMGAPLHRVLVVGCEPAIETIDPDGAGLLGLSDPVREAIGEAIGMIDRLLAQIASEASRSQVQSAGGS